MDHYRDYASRNPSGMQPYCTLACSPLGRWLFGEGRADALGDADLEGVQRVADQGVVADDADHLDQASLTQARDHLGKARIGEPLRFEQLGADLMDEGFVPLRKAWCLAPADRLDGGSRDTGLLREGCVREPLELRTPEAGGGDNGKLRKAVRQGCAPAQMLAELCRVLANLRRADQQLERAAEPAAAAGDDQVVNPALGRCHLTGRDVAITGQSFLLCAFGHPRRTGHEGGAGVR